MVWLFQGIPVIFFVKEISLFHQPLSLDLSILKHSWIALVPSLTYIRHKSFKAKLLYKSENQVQHFGSKLWKVFWQVHAGVQINTQKHVHTSHCQNKQTNK